MKDLETIDYHEKGLINTLLEIQDRVIISVMEDTADTDEIAQAYYFQREYFIKWFSINEYGSLICLDPEYKKESFTEVFQYPLEYKIDIIKLP